MEGAERKRGRKRETIRNGRTLQKRTLIKDTYCRLAQIS